MAKHEMISPRFWDAEPDEAPLVDAELKARIADEGLTFAVEGIRDVATEYGPTWMLDVEFEGRRWTLPMSHTARRDEQLKRMQAHLKAHGPVECGLARFAGKQGSGWVLTAPRP